MACSSSGSYALKKQPTKPENEGIRGGTDTRPSIFLSVSPHRVLFRQQRPATGLHHDPLHRALVGTWGKARLLVSMGDESAHGALTDEQLFERVRESHRDGRGARPTKRDEGAYWAYSTKEQRGQTGCIARRMQRGLLPRAVRAGVTGGARPGPRGRRAPAARCARRGPRVTALGPSPFLTVP